MVFEVVKALALGPIIRIILQIADPCAVFFPIDEFHRGQDTHPLSKVYLNSSGYWSLSTTSTRPSTAVELEARTMMNSHLEVHRSTIHRGFSFSLIIQPLYPQEFAAITPQSPFATPQYLPGSPPG